MNYLLVGDIGGTNPRLAMLDSSNTLVFKKSISFEKHSFSETVNLFLKEAAEFHYTTDSACFAIATVDTHESKIHLTNSEVIIDIEEILASTMLTCVKVINDFEAISYAVKTLPKKDASLFCVQDGDVVLSQHGNEAVVGCGTGLGVGYIVEDDERLIVTQSLGGHSGIAVSKNMDKLLSFVRKELGVEVVSAESLLSGNGLILILKYLLKRKHKDVEGYNKLSRNIVSDDVFLKADLKDWPQLISENYYYNVKANSALHIFSALLGSFVQSAALHGLSHRGIFIAGGIVPKNLFMFDQDFFKDMFLQTYKEDVHELLLSIPIYVVKNYDISLVGCGIYFRG